MISWIAMDFFSKSPVLAFPLLALMIFLMVFTFKTFKALRLPKQEIQKLAYLPFTEEPFADASQFNESEHSQKAVAAQSSKEVPHV